MCHAKWGPSTTQVTRIRQERLWITPGMHIIFIWYFSWLLRRGFQDGISEEFHGCLMGDPWASTINP